jgi:hypothetical protein
MKILITIITITLFACTSFPNRSVSQYEICLNNAEQDLKIVRSKPQTFENHINAQAAVAVITNSLGQNINIYADELAFRDFVQITKFYYERNTLQTVLENAMRELDSAKRKKIYRAIPELDWNPNSQD